MAKELLGYYTLKEDTKMRTQYETASWYEEVLVKAGKYEVIQYDGSYHQCYIKFHGECIASDFTSLYGGVPYGSKIDKEVGKHIQVSRQEYDYNIAEMAMNGKIELVDGLYATEETFISSFDNREITVKKLKRK